jgi:hypothetical protein
MEPNGAAAQREARKNKLLRANQLKNSFRATSSASSSSFSPGGIDSVIPRPQLGYEAIISEYKSLGTDIPVAERITIRPLRSAESVTTGVFKARSNTFEPSSSTMKGREYRLEANTELVSSRKIPQRPVDGRILGFPDPPKSVASLDISNQRSRKEDASYSTRGISSSKNTLGAKSTPTSSRTIISHSAVHASSDEIFAENAVSKTNFPRIQSEAYINPPDNPGLNFVSCLLMYSIIYLYYIISWSKG